MSLKKFGPDRFSRFDVYWIQTNKQTDKQTDRQAKFIDRRTVNLKFKILSIDNHTSVKVTTILKKGHVNFLKWR